MALIMNEICMLHSQTLKKNHLHCYTCSNDDIHAMLAQSLPKNKKYHIYVAKRKQENDLPITPTRHPNKDMDGMRQQHKPQMIYELRLAYKTDSSTVPKRALDQLLLKYQQEIHQAVPYISTPIFEQESKHGGR
eukprot:3193670-Karenia_brevis.AAC.1